MPFEHDIGDSKPEIKSTKPTWKSIGELARKLAEKAAAK